MSTSEAQLRASKKYHDKFEKLQIRVTFEEKAAVEKHAAQLNESVNSFVRRAITETISQDLAKNECLVQTHILSALSLSQGFILYRQFNMAINKNPFRSNGVGI